MASVAELKKSFFAEIDKVENREDLELNKFFRERTHVEAIDYEKICRSVFLPKVRTSVGAPKKAELIAFTRLLQKGPRLNEPIWVLTASGDAKPSNQVFMGDCVFPRRGLTEERELFASDGFSKLRISRRGSPIGGRWLEGLSYQYWS